MPEARRSIAGSCSTFSAWESRTSSDGPTEDISDADSEGDSNGDLSPRYEGVDPKDLAGVTSASPCGRTRPERSPEAPRRIDVGPIPDAADSRPNPDLRCDRFGGPDITHPDGQRPGENQCTKRYLGPCQAPGFGDTQWSRPTSCARGAKTSGSLGLDTAYDRGWAKEAKPPGLGSLGL